MSRPRIYAIRVQPEFDGFILPPASGLDADLFNAPDLIQPVVGFRKWLLVGDELLSPLARTSWGAAPMRARCMPRPSGVGRNGHKVPPHAGPAPDPDCACGLYALFAPHRLWGPQGPGLVPGAVVLWGRIEVHDGGMRAKCARIVALALPSFYSPSGKAAVRRVAERLGVEAVPARQLQAAAQRHGRPLPAALLPA